MKEILNFQKYFGIWSPEFRKGYQDFIWDRGCKSQHPEYLKGYEYGEKERIECRGTFNAQKPSKRINEKVEEVKRLLAEGFRQCDIAKIVDVSESYVHKIKNGIVK